jgi:hypothetical protein
MTVNNEMETMWQEAAWIAVRYYPPFEGPGKNQKKLNELS